MEPESAPAMIRSTPPPESNVELILHRTLRLAGKETVNEVAKQEMADAMEEAAYDSGDDTIWGNESGRQIWKTCSRRDQQLDGMIRRMERMEEQLNVMNARFLRIRSHRIETYKRDVLGIRDADVAAIIHDGNDAAHNGDAIADMYLYKTGMRRDTDSLLQLYGLTFDEIVFLYENKRYDTIGLIDAWSTRATNRHNVPIPNEVNEAFGAFINELRKNLGADPGDRSSDLGRAFTAFQRANNRY